MTILFTPPEGFNLVDYRDFTIDPDLPPYVLRFKFSENIIVKRIVVIAMGWNLPECNTDDLFSKIVVSKNGMQDVYYNRPGGRAGIDRLDFSLARTLTTTSPNDEISIAFFPICPVHMIDIDQIQFLSSSDTSSTSLPPTTSPMTTPTPSSFNDEDNLETTTTKRKIQKQTQFQTTNISQEYWYLYATVAVLILILMISILSLTLYRRNRQSCSRVV